MWRAMLAAALVPLGFLAGVLRAQPCVQWVSEAPVFDGPIGRSSAAIAFDSTRGVAVLFGGYGDNMWLGDTWEWDGVAWSERTGPGPPRRHSAGLAFDPLRRRTLLYGGQGDRFAYGDLWQWDGEQWGLLRETNAPGARYGAAVAFDTRRGVLVVFGGDTPDPQTYEWDGSAWTVSNVPGPPPRVGWACAFDSRRGVVVLFGGDTWEWNGSVWRKRIVAGPGDWAAAYPMAFDSGRGVCVLLASERRTWEWDGVSWVMRPARGPDTEDRGQMTYDSSRQRTLLFSGYNWGDHVESTWEWDGAAWSKVANPRPQLPVNHAMAFDEVSGRSLMFGGFSDWRAPWGRVLGDLWEWDGAAWRFRRADGPSPREGHTFVFDPHRRHTVLFGGRLDEPLLSGETWVWDRTVWTRLDVMGPTPRRDHAAAFDRRRGVMVLFGGVDASGPRADTWEWDGAQWRLAAESGPPPQSGHAMCYDRARDLTLLFGQRETWAWEDGTWRRRSTGGPPVVFRHALVYDDRRERAVLFGGYGYSRETWEWDGSGWELATVVGPSARYDHDMAYNSEDGSVLLFGGQSAWRETWRLTPADVSVRVPPAPQYVARGGTAVFTVQECSAGPPAFQWRRDGLPLVDDGRITGAATAALTIRDADLPDTAAYDVVIRSGTQSVISPAAVLTVAFSGPCYADCDRSTGAGVLDIFDFLCFQNAYAQNSRYACDCWADPLLSPGCDMFDFMCFQQAFSRGCP